MRVGLHSRAEMGISARVWLVVVLLLGLSACSRATSANDASAAATSASTSRPTPSGSSSAKAAPTVEQKAVLSAYRAYWIAFASAGNPPNPNSSDLAAHAIDPELSRARQAITAWSKDSVTVEFAYSHVDATATINGTNAVVNDCMSLAGKVVQHGARTGSSATNPQPVAVTADLRLVSGKWMVTTVNNGTTRCLQKPTKPTSRG
jgi:hypothetical protein